MRIATWNINSIRARAARVTNWLVQENIDVLALQETKCTPEQFPTRQFEEIGYQVAAHGINQWNGVALIARDPINEIENNFPGVPGFASPGNPPVLEARAIGATIAGIQFWSLYAPNGRALDDPHYNYKLAWFRALTETVRARLSENPARQLVLMGDLNIAPLDADVGDPSFVPGISTHISAEERAAFWELENAGLHDMVRSLVPGGYTFWDYRNQRFQRDEGMRIDFALASKTLSERVYSAAIHRQERLGDAPSDHVPVVVSLNSAEDNPNEDDRPMVF